jgi:hypothetical protein
MAIKF